MFEDSTKAIELDDTQIKAYLTNGEALVEIGKHDEIGVKRIDRGIQRIEKALMMCFYQKKREFQKDIEVQLKKAKKIRWYKMQEMENKEKLVLMN